MHDQQRNWCIKLKEKYPDYFHNKRVLEVGSADFNGSVRSLFTDCEYIGIDVKPFKGVDVVTIAHEYDVEDRSFDVVCSTSSLEHDMFWEKTLVKMVNLVKKGGLMFFSCSGTTAEHGTAKNTPHFSLSTQVNDEWANFFKNFTATDIGSVLDLNDLFIEWTMGLDSGLDFWFIGIRHVKPD